MQLHEPYYMRPQFFEILDNVVSEKDIGNSLDDNHDKVTGESCFINIFNDYYFYIFFIKAVK